MLVKTYQTFMADIFTFAGAVHVSARACRFSTSRRIASFVYKIMTWQRLRHWPPAWPEGGHGPKSPLHCRTEFHYFFRGGGGGGGGRGCVRTPSIAQENDQNPHSHGHPSCVYPVPHRRSSACLVLYRYINAGLPQGQGGLRGCIRTFKCPSPVGTPGV